MVLARRQDIVDKIEQQLQPPEQPEESPPPPAMPVAEQPTVNNFLEPDLLPSLLKQVDHTFEENDLRAEGKL